MKIDCINRQRNKFFDFLSLDHYEFDMISDLNVTSKCRQETGVSITAKQTAEPLPVRTNGAPSIPGASQAIRGLGE